ANSLTSVIPAKAGTQESSASALALGPAFAGRRKRSKPPAGRRRGCALQCSRAAGRRAAKSDRRSRYARKTARLPRAPSRSSGSALLHRPAFSGSSSIADWDCNGPGERHRRPPAARRSELCYSPSSGLLVFFLDNKADLSIDAVHRDLVVLDDAFGILDPERFDAAHGLRSFFDRLLACLIKPL